MRSYGELMRSVQNIEVEGMTLGKGHPCLIAAEVGINHNGDFDLAKESILAAAKAGADAVKFQNYRTEDFIADRTLTYEYVSKGQKVVETQYEMFKRYEMPREWIPDLQACCRENDVIFFSTPTSEDGIKDLLSAGISLFKNGSDFLGHLPLISAFARTGKPTVLSTGMATSEDIDEAVDTYEKAGGNQLILLHCTSSYPTSVENANLARMITLQERYECLVGFSDHTEGVHAASIARSMGAVFIEKHFTISTDLPGPDHSFSLNPEDFSVLVQQVRATERLLGSDIIVPADSEQSSRSKYRLSCRAARNLPTGTCLGKGDIALSRPGDGMPPSSLAVLIGQRLNCQLEAGDPIQDHCLESDG